ncbi:linear amide C-N hydrolase [Candidatus Bipolaricaulota bacterium]
MITRRVPVLLVLVLTLLIAETGQACTSFAIPTERGSVLSSVLEGSFTAGLLFINARGVQKRGVRPNASGEFAEWASTYGSVTFSLAGYQQVWAGMNQSGLAISTMANLYNLNRSETTNSQPPLDAGLWMQYVLDTCASISDVQSVSASVSMGANVDHFLACDRAGNSSVIEFIDGKMRVYTGEELPVSALTNPPYEMMINRWYEEDMLVPSLTEWQEQLYERFARAAHAVTNWIARDLSIPASDYALAVQKDMGRVRWGIAFDSGNMTISYNTYDNGDVREIDFARLSFSCGFDGMMLDITGDTAGDLSLSFEPYSRERNVRQYLHITSREDDPSAAEGARILQIS